MSMVSDLREALQDVVAPDLKAVVRGLADLTASVAQLREEMKEGNTQLRDEMKAGNAQLRDEMKEGNAQLREEMKAIVRRSTERLDASERCSAERLESSEARTTERLARVYEKIEIVDLTRRNEQLTREIELLRSRQAEQRQ